VARLSADGSALVWNVAAERISPFNLQEFVADVWPLAEESSDIVYWAQEFESGHGNMTA